MKYAVEMGLCAMIYVPGFIKIGLSIQKLRGGGIHIDTHKHTHTEHGDIMRLLLFSQNKEIRLKFLNCSSILSKTIFTEMAFSSKCNNSCF
jgi:hypothetical protein